MNAPRKIDPVVLAILGAATVLLAVDSALAATFEGKVIGLADGDTITVLDSRKQRHEVRLAAIDAPETGQPFGRRAKEHLASLVFLKTVRVEWDKLDRYDRRNGKVWVISPDSSCRSHDCPKTLDVGLYMLSVGLVWHYKRYENEQTFEDRERYAYAEREARARRAGLWAFSHPVPPWLWRHHIQRQTWRVPRSTVHALPLRCFVSHRHPPQRLCASKDNASEREGIPGVHQLGPVWSK